MRTKSLDGAGRRALKEVWRLFHERLNAGNTGYLRDPALLPVRFSAYRPKYEAIEQALGKATLESMEKCSGGATISRVAVGVFPPRPADSEARDRPYDAWVGFILDCQEPVTAGDD